MSLALIILAAGQSTRMKSKIAKVLHPLAGKPMVEYSLDTARALGIAKPLLVVGYQSDRVRALVGDRAEFVEQREQKGTAHAVRQARAVLEGRAETILVNYADMPLLTAETMGALYSKHQQARACVTILTAFADDAMGFGRIIRDANGKPRRIVEDSEATPDERAIKELNCGLYCFDAAWLWQHLEEIQPSPKKGEYYLTDLMALAVAQKALVETYTLDNAKQIIGINTRIHLARAEQVMRDRIRERVMLNGATLIDPSSTFIDADVEVGEDTVIFPGTQLAGKTRIGADCRIGPHAQIHDSQIGDGCEISSSLLEQTVLENLVKIGPFCHLRPGSYLARGVHLGDHAEIKNARLGPEVKMGHFSYIGDAEVGARANIGAGTITCNFDGVRKNHTTIGEDAFIGSDTMLVAPVTVGARSHTGAGAVVIEDIPPDSLAVGVPARIVRKLA